MSKVEKFERLLTWHVLRIISGQAEGLDAEEGEGANTGSRVTREGLFDRDYALGTHCQVFM
jgi:hypothetical protein